MSMVLPDVPLDKYGNDILNVPMQNAFTLSLIILG